MRERRRARTWGTIHAAAYQLAAERGVKQTTAELIADQAGVSPRTFFNYFATKEDAIIGLRTPRMTQEILDGVQNRGSGSLLGQAAQLLASVLYQSFASTSWEDFRAFLREHEELQRRMKIHMLACEQELKDFLLQMDWAVYRTTGMFAPREDSGSEPDPEQEERIRALVLLATASLRYLDYAAEPLSEEFTTSIDRTVSVFSTLVKEPH